MLIFLRDIWLVKNNKKDHVSDILGWSFLVLVIVLFSIGIVTLICDIYDLIIG